MEKFIRTKEAVYEVIKNDFGVCIKIDCMFILLDDIKDKIIKESDTIPELCDGFYIDVCEPIFEKQFIYSKEEYYDFHYMITQCLKENDVKYKAYGFIKTSKGLIYISELKDKDMVLI